MKLADALVKQLKISGVTHVFGLQGGAVVHIFDSFERAGIGVTYTHHEESAALAAVAHAKITGQLGCVVVTTGPGSTNAITGLLAAWQDSIPCIFISGQVRSNHTSYGRKVRQVGTQEVNICDIVRPITKYTKFVDNKDNFIDDLKESIRITNSDRPGPVWIDIPLEFHWSDIQYNDDLVEDKLNKKNHPVINDEQKIKYLKLMSESKKPLLILGYGSRLSGALDVLEKFIEKRNIPFVTTWTASDFFPTDHPLNLGVIGMSGQRGANQAVFNADLLLCYGTHLSIPHTTTLFEDYAPNAKKIIVNIDQDQLDNLNVKFDLQILSDIKEHIEWLYDQSIAEAEWDKLKTYKDANWYTTKDSDLPNSNNFIHELTKSITDKKCLVVDGGGTALYAGFQSAVMHKNDRIICSSAISSMGTGLAETIGVSKSGEFSKYICVIGDGSLMMNIQDLQTIRQDNINVIICVINNNGYLAIRHTQNEFLEGRLYGTHPDWNLTMPSFEKIANAFDIEYMKLDQSKDTDKIIDKISTMQGPVLCEVIVDENQNVLFKQGYIDNKDGTFSPQPLSEMTYFEN